MVEIIQGVRYVDERGTLIYFNELDFSNIKRFYTIEHFDESVIRAWQGHKGEHKWFYALSGSFVLVLVRPDNWESPSTDLEHQEFTLTSESQQILHVPQGFVNGFRANEPKSRMMVFSNFTLKESSLDDFRFDKDLWYKW